MEWLAFGRELTFGLIFTADARTAAAAATAASTTTATTGASTATITTTTATTTICERKASPHPAVLAAVVGLRLPVQLTYFLQGHLVPKDFVRAHSRLRLVPQCLERLRIRI